MKDRNSFKQDISNKIHNLRLKLNKAYEKYGNTKEVVEISEELDKYIVFVQQQRLERIRKEIK